MGGSEKKRREDPAVKKKQAEIRDLNKNIEDSSEMVHDLADELEATLAEKEKFEAYNDRLEAAADAKWSEFLGDLPEAGSKKMTQNERDRARQYLEKYANKMYDYYGARGNNQSKVGKDVRSVMSDDQVKQMVANAYAHSQEFGDELKKMVQDSRRFLWDRKVDLGQSKIEQNMDVVKSKYVAQMGTYQGMIGDYREAMTEIAKNRLSLEGYFKEDTYKQSIGTWARQQGWSVYNPSRHSSERRKAEQRIRSRTTKIVKGPDGRRYEIPRSHKGFESDEFLKWAEKRSEEAFHAKYSDTDFSAMTLDELEYITSGSWKIEDAKGRIGPIPFTVKSMGKVHWSGNQDWDRDIEDLDSFKWE